MLFLSYSHFKPTAIGRGKPELTFGFWLPFISFIILSLSFPQILFPFFHFSPIDLCFSFMYTPHTTLRWIARRDTWDHLLLLGIP